MKTLDTAVTIASDVRKWAEAEAFKKNYHPGDLKGWCAIAAGELWHRLKKVGIKSNICMSTHDYTGSHCFLLVEDHILDVTATQFEDFEDKKVVVMHSKEAEIHEIYRVEKVFDTGKELRLYQDRNRWPSKQLCYG
jgi:hypothetical protein